MGGVNGCVHQLIYFTVGTIGFKTVKREAGQDNTPRPAKTGLHTKLIHAMLYPARDYCEIALANLYTGE